MGDLIKTVAMLLVAQSLMTSALSQAKHSVSEVANNGGILGFYAREMQHRFIPTNYTVSQ